MKQILLTAVIALAISPVSALAGDSVKTINIPPVTVELKAGDGKARVETMCNICHSLDYITSQPAFTKTQWTGTVTKMIKVMGAPISEDDAKVITEYLAKYYGTKK
jgi:sulfite dehydrogenase (cytochrome) subunit B